MMSDDDGGVFFVVMMDFWQNELSPFVYATPYNGNTPPNTKLFTDDNKKYHHPLNAKFYIVTLNRGVVIAI